jgi:hypothetical protein
MRLGGAFARQPCSLDLLLYNAARIANMTIHWHAYYGRAGVNLYMHRYVYKVMFILYTCMFINIAAFLHEYSVTQYRTVIVVNMLNSRCNCLKPSPLQQHRWAARHH